MTALGQEYYLSIAGLAAAQSTMRPHRQCASSSDVVRVAVINIVIVTTADREAC